MLQGKPNFTTPPLIEKYPPRCPPFVEVKSVDDLLPYLDEVAKRPYSQGLHAAWDLQPGERVLLRADNWHDPMVIEACKRILEKYNTKYEVVMADKGPIPTWKGHNEVEYYLARTKELAEWMDEWEQIEKEGKYDKLLWGYGGPVLCDANIKIQRMPFITPELTATPAHTIAYEIIDAIDKWTWDRIRNARRIRITDPEGTDLSYTNHDAYYDSKREFFNPDLVDRFWSQNKNFGKTYLPGHVLGRPWMYLPKEDASGVIAGTSNHIGPVPWVQLKVEDGRITDIHEGGEFGDKLRKLQDETRHLQYPGFPDKGLLRWWEASIGTNPHIHRPRRGFLQGWLNCLYERMRSGVIHMGFGTIISSSTEREAAKMGLPVGHWHLHLYFATMTCEMVGGGTETIIQDGRLMALDDPDIRNIAAKYGDPDLLLTESWIPAVPGINVAGDYWKHYANDPEDWVLAELKICENYHHLFMSMVGADPKYCNNPLWKLPHSHDACSCGHHHG
ncbi:hypothetical protein EXW96_10545 [Paenibacillus sp. JMULE4]|uniref:hypothetical protein n=1 Tax=Paenibacillus TaxID=44249 RepID=UPI000887DB26|nr:MULTISPECIES: hypothetical protein [Paenibacillus]NTZ17990.1 hypothetical protein [Paenibacillus sp. JMULE4]SDJ88603.1 Leucyl aminopeptidase (aminopeptidase T) [Paenibacillus naphthalenovorans]